MASGCRGRRSIGATTPLASLQVAVDVGLLAAWDAAEQSGRRDLRRGVECGAVPREHPNGPEASLGARGVARARGHGPAHGEIDGDRAAVSGAVGGAGEVPEEPGLPLNVDLDTTLTVIAGNLYRLLARRLPRYQTATPDTIFRHFIKTPGQLHVTPDGVQVHLEPRTRTPVLLDANYHTTTTTIPWWDGRQLTYSFPPA